MSTSRHLSRIIALQALFAYEFEKGKYELASKSNEVFSYICEEFKDKTTDFSYAKVLFDGVKDNLEKIHADIAHFAPEWPIEKIARIDRVILEIAMFEMLMGGDVPPVVALDEAIELSKQYGNQNTPKFINGVLNALLNDPRTPRKTASA